MKHAPAPQSATSLPVAPRAESDARMRRYAITMGIRMVCLVLMVVITPYGWWTWVCAAGAAFLPYIAVVFANVGHDGTSAGVVPVERAIAAAEPRPAKVEPAETTIVVHESPARPDESKPDRAR